MTYRNCTFEGNSAATWGGAIWVAEGAAANVENCFFRGNNCFVGSCMYVYRATGGRIENNTFHGNLSTGAVYLHQSPRVSFHRNIVSGEVNGLGLSLDSSESPHTCNIYWNNEKGAIGVYGNLDPLDPSETAKNPVYCDILFADFTVSTLGPTAPANSACGELIGAFPTACAIEPPPDPNAAFIASIEDVPGDEGGWVRIKFGASQLDADGAEPQITGYGIYRYDQPILEEPFLALAPSYDGVLAEGWDYLFTVPARGDDVYQTVAMTLCDTPRDDGGVRAFCKTAYFISAETNDPLVFFDSKPDTGYSVDNITPDPPQEAVATGGPSGTRVKWQPSQSVDLEGYRVYKGSTPDFALDPGNVLGDTKETEWMDLGGVAGRYYKITALDDAGNESPAASATATGGPVVSVYALEQNAPNPFNPTTTIRYTVGAGVRSDKKDGAGSLVAASS